MPPSQVMSGCRMSRLRSLMSCRKPYRVYSENRRALPQWPAVRKRTRGNTHSPQQIARKSYVRTVLRGGEHHAGALECLLHLLVAVVVIRREELLHPLRTHPAGSARWLSEHQSHGGDKCAPPPRGSDLDVVLGEGLAELDGIGDGQGHVAVQRQREVRPDLLTARRFERVTSSTRCMMSERADGNISVGGAAAHRQPAKNSTFLRKPSSPADGLRQGGRGGMPVRHPIADKRRGARERQEDCCAHAACCL